MKDRQQMREKETRESEQGYWSQMDKGQPLDGEGTDASHRQMVVY